MEDAIPLSTPLLVFLDPSDDCNFRCKFCPSGDRKLLKSVGRIPRRMDFGLYKSIIKGLKEFPEPIKTLRLYKDGEPLLNADIAEMVWLAKETGVALSVDLTTNGSLFNPVLNEKITEAGLDKIFVSVPREYSRRYIDGVGDFYQRSRKTGCQVFCKINGDELDEEALKWFRRDFDSVCDEIAIEHTAPCWPEHEVQGVNPDLGIYGQPLEGEVQVCPYVFYSMAINSDGTVSVCFLDWKHTHLIGDLKVDTPKAVWNGDLLWAYRMLQLTGRRKANPFCGSCGQLRYGKPDNIDQYADQIRGRL